MQTPTCHRRNDVLQTLHLGNQWNDVLWAKTYGREIEWALVARIRMA
jgi:hypothetical protein